MRKIFIGAIVLASFSTIANADVLEIKQMKCRKGNVFNGPQSCGFGERSFVNLSIGEMALPRFGEVPFRKFRQISIDIKLARGCYYIRERFKVDGQIATKSFSAHRVEQIHRAAIHSSSILDKDITTAFIKFPENMDEVQEFEVEINLVRNVVDTNGSISTRNRIFTTVCELN